MGYIWKKAAHMPPRAAGTEDPETSGQENRNRGRKPPVRHIFYLSALAALVILARCNTPSPEPPAAGQDGTMAAAGKETDPSALQREGVDYLLEKYPGVSFCFLPVELEGRTGVESLFYFEDPSVPGRTFELHADAGENGNPAFTDNYYAVRAEKTISRFLKHRLSDAGLCVRGIATTYGQPAGKDTDGTEPASKLIAVSATLGGIYDIFLDPVDHGIGYTDELEYAETVIIETGLCGEFNLYMCGPEAASMKDGTECRELLDEKGEEAFTRHLDFQVP